MANFCSACGNAVNPDARFCARCGSALEDVQPPEPVPPAPEAVQPAPELLAPERESVSDPSMERPAGRARLDKVADWEPMQSGKRRSFGKRIGIGVASVVGAVFLLLILASMCEPDDTETPTGYVSALCEREVEAAYLVDLENYIAMFVRPGGILSELMAEMGRNPALVMDSKWLDDVGIAITFMNIAADEITGLQAPDSLNEIDREAKGLAREIRASMDLYVVGIDEIDGSKVQQGTARIYNAGDYMNDMYAAIDRLCGL